MTVHSVDYYDTGLIDVASIEAEARRLRTRYQHAFIVNVLRRIGNAVLATLPTDHHGGHGLRPSVS